MHTIKLKVKDSVFDKVLYFLDNLPKDEVIIVENEINTNQDLTETKALSNHSANLIDEWKESSEDDVWK